MRSCPGGWLRPAAVTLILMATSCAGPARGGDGRGGPADPELLHSAVGSLSDVIVYDIFSPPQASRTYAYASVAAYEALRWDHPEYRSLAGQLNELEELPAPAPDQEYSFPLAAVHAYMTVGRALTFSPARMDTLRSELGAEFRRRGVSRPVYDRSVAYGEAVGAHVLAWARRDRFLERLGHPKFTVTSEPGRWVPTPPAYMDAVEPNWALLRPFVMDSAGMFQPPPPPRFDMRPGARFYHEAREVYDVGRTLTAEQREVAEFWNNNPYTMNVQGHTMFATKQVSPGGHWMGIVADASRQSGADIMRAAEAYALAAVAVADGFISCWDAKYRSNLVRPETVINMHFDEAWQPLLQTPPFPEYPSGHSVISAAAARALARTFGEHFAFTDSSQVRYVGVARSFKSFDEAAMEAAISRLYGGIHYRVAIDEGVREGMRVGQLVVERVRTRGEDDIVAARPTGVPVASRDGGS